MAGQVLPKETVRSAVRVVGLNPSSFDEMTVAVRIDWGDRGIVNEHFGLGVWWVVCWTQMWQTKQESRAVRHLDKLKLIHEMKWTPVPTETPINLTDGMVGPIFRHFRPASKGGDLQLLSKTK